MSVRQIVSWVQLHHISQTGDLEKNRSEGTHELINRVILLKFAKGKKDYTLGMQQIFLFIFYYIAMNISVFFTG